MGTTCHVYEGHDHAANLHPGISQCSEEDDEQLCTPPDYTLRKYEGYDFGEVMTDNGDGLPRSNPGASSSSESASAELLHTSVESGCSGPTSRVRPASGVE